MESGVQEGLWVGRQAILQRRENQERGKSRIAWRAIRIQLSSSCKSEIGKMPS